MADFIRCIVSAWDSSDPKQDRISNTIYFKKATGPDIEDPDWDPIANDVLTAFNLSQLYWRGVDRTECRVYDMEQPEPRVPMATRAQNKGMSPAGVREVALCLSFRGMEPRPRQKGRIFLGPYAQTHLNGRPDLQLRNDALALASRLGGIGGPDIDWCVFSPTTFAATQGSLGQSFFPIQQAWCDDAWDIQRSRGLDPTTRSVQGMNE